MRILQITNTYKNKYFNDNPVIKNIIYGISEDSDFYNTVAVPVKKIRPEKGFYTEVFGNVKEFTVPIFGMPYGLLIDFRLKHSGKKLTDIFCKEDFDVIHSHSFISDGYPGYLISLKTGKPLVLSINGTDVYEQLVFYPHLRKTAMKIFRHASAVICMSSAVKERFSEILGLDKKEKDFIRVVPNGLKKSVFENSVYSASVTEPFRFIFVGKLIKLKNLRRTLKAFSMAVKNNYDFYFDIVGSGREEKILKNMVKNCGIGGRVNFSGQLSGEDVLKAVKNSSCFIMCSTKETFGMVYIEALSQYRPIIFSAGRGVDGLFLSEPGISCNPKDIKSIYSAMTDIYNNYSYYAEEVKKFNTDEFNFFTVENTVNTYKEIYRGVLK
ncbi:MAG TPA: glycosyltransferase family 4 protein [Tepiditoga sp.]|nr:glycosyltransferase family 4 protein [Tepiditoga sp.]